MNDILLAVGASDLGIGIAGAMLVILFCYVIALVTEPKI